MMFGIWMDILSKIDECSTATDVVKSVNILIAVRWVAEAWSMVKAETISKCLKEAGIFDSSMDMVTRDEEDLFLAADELALQDLMKTNKQLMVKTVARWRSMKMVKIVFLFAWSLIVTDVTKVFCRILGVMHMTRKIASEQQDKSMADIEPPPLKIKTVQEAKDSCNKP